MYAVAPTRTIVYCRVSLDKQAEKGVSLAAQQAKAKALLVVKLDRLTRSVADLGRLVERYFAPGKAALLSVGEQIDTRSAAGRLVLNVLASVSQWEREANSQRFVDYLHLDRQPRTIRATRMSSDTSPLTPSPLRREGNQEVRPARSKASWRF